MEDGAILPVLVKNRNGYKNLCELLTQAHLRSEKGKCAVKWSELSEFAHGLIAFLGSAPVWGALPKNAISPCANSESSLHFTAHFPFSLRKCACVSNSHKFLYPLRFLTSTGRIAPS